MIECCQFNVFCFMYNFWPVKKYIFLVQKYHLAITYDGSQWKKGEWEMIKKISRVTGPK